MKKSNPEESRLLEWPEEGIVPYTELMQPVIDAFRRAYKLRRINADEDVIYRGYNLGEKELASQRDPVQALSAENLRYDLEIQGRPAIEKLFQIAFALGMEQSRRLP